MDDSKRAAADAAASNGFDYFESFEFIKIQTTSFIPYARKDKVIPPQSESTEIQLTVIV